MNSTNQFINYEDATVIQKYNSEYIGGELDTDTPTTPDPKPATHIETVDFDERMSQLLKHVDDAKSLAEFKQIVTYYR